MFLLFLLFGIKAFLRNNDLTPPPNNVPLEVTVNLQINKIYNINTVHETYQIDGFLIYSWIDEHMISTDTLNNIQLYENDKARELIDTKTWIPAIELIFRPAKKLLILLLKFTRMKNCLRRKVFGNIQRLHKFSF